MIKSNCSLSKHDQESTLEFRLYMLVILVIMIKLITTFILLLIKIMNLTSINHASTQKINQVFSQKFKTKIYFSI